MPTELDRVLSTHGNTHSVSYLRAAYKIARQYAIQHFGRGRQLGRLTSKAFPLPWDWQSIPWLEIAVWMIAERKSGLARGSWNLYKHAMIAMDPANTRLRSLLMAAQHTQEPRYPKITASQVQKHLNPEELAKIRAVIGSNRDTANEHRWGDVLILWLRAGVSTGLRPSEWPGCQLVESAAGPFLRVINGKRDSILKRFPKSCMPLSRDIPIGHLPQEELLAVKTFVQFIREATVDGQFTFIYQGCRFLMHQITRQIWPRRQRFPTIYSARYQFELNMKAQGKSSDEIAALVGRY